MSVLITYILVLAIGIAIGYFAASRSADQSKQKDPKRELLRLYKESPEFIDELRSDLAKPEFSGVREFAIVQSSQITFVSDVVRFVYYEENIPDLRSIAENLEALDFVDDVTTGRMPIYRMRESFIEAVRNL